MFAHATGHVAVTQAHDWPSLLSLTRLPGGVPCLATTRRLGRVFFPRPHLSGSGSIFPEVVPKACFLAILVLGNERFLDVMTSARCRLLCLERRFHAGARCEVWRETSAPEGPPGKFWNCRCLLAVGTRIQGLGLNGRGLLLGISKGNHRY